MKEFLSPFRDASRYYNEDEIFYLILSIIRTNEANIGDIQKTKNRTQYNADIQKIEDWIKTRLVPNTIEIGVDDKELLNLLMFSLAMSYKMLKGETSATMSEKALSGEERYFGQIFSDVFKGKIGEVVFKEFVKQNFGRDITLDWNIGRQIETFKSDIVGSRKMVSIKSTDTLESIWAEAPKNADYGILVKVSLPKDFFIKILAHISSLEKLLNFVREKMQENISASNILNLVDFIKETAYQEEMIIKGFTAGFFKTSKANLKSPGDKLTYLGGEFEIYEDKHIVKCNELKFSERDWDSFFKDII